MVKGQFVFPSPELESPPPAIRGESGSASNAVCLQGAAFNKPLKFKLEGITGSTFGEYNCPVINGVTGVGLESTSYESDFVHLSFGLPIATFVNITTTVPNLPIVILDGEGVCTDFEVGYNQGRPTPIIVSRTLYSGLHRILLPGIEFGPDDFLNLEIVNESFNPNTVYCGMSLKLVDWNMQHVIIYIS